MQLVFVFRRERIRFLNQNGVTAAGARARSDAETAFSIHLPSSFANIPLTTLPWPRGTLYRTARNLVADFCTASRIRAAGHGFSFNNRPRRVLKTQSRKHPCGRQTDKMDDSPPLRTSLTAAGPPHFVSDTTTATTTHPPSSRCRRHRLHSRRQSPSPW